MSAITLKHTGSHMDSLQTAQKLSPDKIKNRKNGIIAVSLISVAIVALYHIPYGHYLLYPLMLLYTFIHESGHGIAAEMMGGDFVKFEMWIDGSGMATSAVPDNLSAFGTAFISFGGLIAPAIVAAICLILGRSAKASRIGFYVLGALSALSVALYVRNTFGIIFVLACAAVFILVAHFVKSKAVHQYGMLFIAISLLTSVFSRGDYLFTRDAQTATGVHLSDVGQIADALWLPYWFWGGLIAILSVAILLFGIRAFFYLPQEKTKKPDQIEA